MSLQSQLFRGDPKLEAAAVSDPAHILPGAVGQHVAKIQGALMELDGAAIDPGELRSLRYGPSTADAVLAYKRKRDIVNRRYQTAADNIVGKMTIAALDREILANEAVPPAGRVCRLYLACPPDAGGQPARSGMAGFAVSGDRPSPEEIMNVAFRTSRRCLWDARGDLMSVAGALRQNQPLSTAQEKTFAIAVSWLKLNRADQAACITHLDKAADLMLRNHNLKTSTGGDVVLTYAVGESYHALSHMNSPDSGLKCGDPFFNPDGPNCRRDVVTHEFFHMIGVEHGGCPLNGPTIRSAITIPAQALNSADNLAQLVAELRTFKTPNTDACTRAGD